MRYDPVRRDDGRLILRCLAPSETGMAHATARLRWHDHAGHLLVWETAALRLPPEAWADLPVALPVVPRRSGFLRFTLSVDGRGLPAERHVGFVQAAAAAPAVAAGEVLALRIAPERQAAFATPDAEAAAADIVRLPFRRLSQDGSGLVVAGITGLSLLHVRDGPGTDGGALAVSPLPGANRKSTGLALPEAGLRSPAARLLAETGDGRLQAARLRATVAPRPGIAVVVTSCARQDLLRRTLDSFFAHNTCHVAQIIVVEDGPGAANAPLWERFARHGIIWLATERRVGQIAAIDYAYSFVEHDHIFHLEDDWEFYEGGFIEKSLAILQARPDCVQVWIRALNDTNRHPIAAEPEWVAGLPVRRVLPGYLDKWHGFTFNPGLRRTVDYDRIGKYGWHVRYDAADPDGSEWRLSSLYRQRGLHAVILADNHGKGYVRHSGFGRRVVDRTLIG